MENRETEMTIMKENEMEKVSGGTITDAMNTIVEKLLNCKQGKHEWEETIEGEYQPDGAYLFRKVYTCKICKQISYGAWDIKRD